VLTATTAGEVGTSFALLAVLAAVVDFLVKVVALGLVPQNRRPSSAWGWLLLIFFLPFVGVVAFVLIGSPFVDSRRRREQAEVDEVIRERARDLPDAVPPGEVRGWLRSALALGRELGSLPAVAGNRVDLLPEYDEAVAAMTRAVDGARDFVNVQFYILGWDSTTEPFWQAVTRAVDRGVRVRVLFDHIGTWRVGRYRELCRRLDATGAEWHEMLPIRPWRGRWRRPDLRNHRKIVVVDDEVAFTGSQNLIDAGYHRRGDRRWKELFVEVRGPVVSSLDAVFATDWYVETHERLDEQYRGREVAEPTGDDPGDLVCQVVPSGPWFPQENNLRLFNTLIYGARERISITSPYFVPDESLLYAITTAAQRGVAVELFVSERSDQFVVQRAQNSYYDTLLDAGVRIYCYPAPAVLHSKHVSVDDVAVVVGSSNLDVRSFTLNFEVSLLCAGGDVVRRVRAVEDAYRAVSTELTAQAWRGRPLWTRYVDNVMRLTSALQ
jgi:cardiolipin synthase